MGNTTEFSRRVRDIGGEICLSASELCDVMNVTQKTVSDWVNKGMPREQYGWYSLKKVLAWRGETKPEGYKDASINLQQRKLEVEIALKETQQEFAALKGDILNGKYLEREYVTEEYRRFFIVLKRAMLAVPRRVAALTSAFLEPIEVRRLEKELTDTVNRALNSFADSIVSDGG